MANFWDLPRPVRKRNYRLNLAHDGVLDMKGFVKACELTSSWTLRGIPLLMQLCDRTE